MAKKWMAKAFANSHGQFRAKAKAAGKSTAEFAREHEHDSGKTGAQARLAERGMEAHHSKSNAERAKGRYGK
jgi:hypothetical protein